MNKITASAQKALKRLQAGDGLEPFCPTDYFGDASDWRYRWISETGVTRADAGYISQKTFAQLEEFVVYGKDGIYRLRAEGSFKEVNTK